MALSQLLDDSPARLSLGHAGTHDQYNERHRLALEELLSGGVDAFLDFLGRERIPNFLSDDETRQIRSAAVAPPRCASLHGDEQDCSADCSSLTYFPEVSDVEPPLLEIGWPAFTAGSYRGVTRAVAHFQPGYGECIYGCKEAARRMIKNAKEVIAIVTDSLTDLDIFKDLQEASSQRRVPVYILLDQSCSLAFLKMCRNIGARLDDLQQMRVRLITGTTYYTRSGARVTGKVHERFMLIDGNKVATGSYRFNWTDGKLNSSNLIELSGQITEKFDEEFRVLYAQSSPLNTRGLPSERNGSILELLKQSAVSSPYRARERPADPACLTSTPTRKQTSALRPTCEPSTPDRSNTNPACDSSTRDGDWTEEQRMQEEILAGSTVTPYHPPTPAVICCHASTQTSRPVVDSGTQTDAQHFDLTAPKNVGQSGATSPCSVSPRQRVADSTLKECFLKMTKERHYHYSAIRCKLEHMVTALSQRGELADITNMIQGPGALGRQRAHKDCGLEPNSRLLAESEAKRTCPRSRCVD